jgi:hypothetical protein
MLCLARGDPVHFQSLILGKVSAPQAEFRSSATRHVFHVVWLSQLVSLILGKIFNLSFWLS